MGRARASMQLIQKPKTKRVTCEKRGESLKKKASELSELCDVDVCMIMYPPVSDGAVPEPPKIWPEDPEKIGKLVALFNGVRTDENRCKFSTVQTYFKDRKRKTEGELDKLKKKNREARYPTSVEMIANLSDESRRELGRTVTDKIEEVRRRIEDINNKMRLNYIAHNNISTSNNVNGFYSNYGQFSSPMYPQNAPVNRIPIPASFSQMMRDATGASSAHYLVEQPLEPYTILPQQGGFNVGYNIGSAMMPQPQKPDWKPCTNMPATGINGYAWSETYRVLGTSSISELKVVDRMETSPYIHM